MQPRYLSKSRFKMAMECPTKLFYTGKEAYVNNKTQDSFLEALADGGFQVGELAKCYHPGGTDIQTLDYEQALLETEVLLQHEQVVIFEAAFRHGPFFVRTDILVKDGDHLELIEVKAKSIEKSPAETFLKRGGKIATDWEPYLRDIAFQKYVVAQACPHYTVSAHLMLADKKAQCPTEGLNQKFKIIKDRQGRKRIVVSSELTKEDLSTRLLRKDQVDEFCEIIYEQTYQLQGQEYGFVELIGIYAEAYAQDQKIVTYPTSACRNCEFNATKDQRTKGLRSGFHECWQEALGWTAADFEEQNILDLWFFKRKDQFLRQGWIKLADIPREEIDKDSQPYGNGLSISQRQWLQIEKARQQDPTAWIDRQHLREQMKKWVYPLHFIDFETAMAAIPFHRGRHPYEAIAFQYAHHTVDAEGRVAHQGQYLNAQPGVFPNYDFLRHLRAELSQDEGSIFCYSQHENSYLNHIYQQLKADPTPIPDREELCAFIRDITVSAEGSPGRWSGKRKMVDLFELVKAYYYDPAVKGSNSIKKVLPAVLNSSRWLQEKYSQPIYGSPDGIPSLNYQDWQWMKWEQGKVVDPYLLLPRLFANATDPDLVLLSGFEELRDGGAALTAYARLQFEEMSDYEREEISQALLKYCELDTLAMVMIYEGWRELVGL